MSSKIIYLGQWVRVANLRNKYFPANRPCSICRRLTCGSVWYSIKTHEVRCLRCFDAETEHWKTEPPHQPMLGSVPSNASPAMLSAVVKAIEEDQQRRRGETEE
jgi:hypothetical protein